MKLGDLIDAGFNLVTQVLTPLAFALCLLYFFWGVAKYIREGAASEKAAEEGRRIMLYSIIGLSVAFSVWGIVIFIRNEFGLTNIPTQIDVRKP